MNYLIMVFERDPTKSYTGFHRDFVAHKQIVAWWHFVTTGYLVVTELDAKGLSEHAEAIFERYGLRDLHLVLEANFANHYGKLPRQAWEWLRIHGKNQWTDIYLTEEKLASMKPEEIQQELINQLKHQGEHLIAKAVESAIGCRVANRVLYLEYTQPSLSNISARILTDSQQKPKLDAVAKQIGIEVQVL